MHDGTKPEYLRLSAEMGVAAAKLAGVVAMGGIKLGVETGRSVGRGIVAYTIGTQGPVEALADPNGVYMKTLENEMTRRRKDLKDPGLVGSIVGCWVGAVRKREPEKPVEAVIYDAAVTLVEHKTPPENVGIAVHRLCELTGVPEDAPPIRELAKAGLMPASD